MKACIGAELGLPVLQTGHGRRRSAPAERGLVADLVMPIQADLGWAGCTAVERDPRRVRGAWLFQGTRIPVAALFEKLEDELLVGGRGLKA